MFKCRDQNGSLQDAYWQYIQDAWLPVVTVCGQRMYKKKIIPVVTNLELTAQGTSVSVTWTPNSSYYTQVQYKNDNGEWIDLPLVAPGTGSL